MTMSIRRTLIAASVALIAAGGVHAAAPAKSEIAIPDIPYTKFVLKNGLTLLVHEDHKTPVVAINTWYHVGSKNEKPGKTGFAHLFEHLMFGGSDNVYTSNMNFFGSTNEVTFRNLIKLTTTLDTACNNCTTTRNREYVF